MTDLEPDTTLCLTVAELDGLLHDIRPEGDDIDDAMRAGYHAGKVEGVEALHRAVIETAETDTPDTE